MDDELTRVVLADDVPEFRRIIRLMLERDGRFEVVGEADSGDQVLELVSEYDPHVLVLDMDMPVSGQEILPKLREAAPDVRVVVLAGVDPGDFGGAAGLGVERIVKKGSPSTSVVRAVTGAAYRNEEES
ncbi:MAG: response regulator transcription factor [Actinobacteria bacterium]|nr:response regulator transcription factor [Actinomycetota bacterium]